MDNIAHAIAGCLLAAATVSLVERRSNLGTPNVRRAATLVGVIAAELPDADLLYAGPMMDMGKLGYLLHHRGHTHTVLFAIASAFLLWGAAVAVHRGLRAPTLRWPLLGLALAGTLSHIALDFTNSYGVHPFWPVVNRWFYGDAMFIIEPWFWVAALPPLLLFARSTAARMAYGLALGAILLAAWLVTMVGRDVALALSIGTAAWFVAVRATPAKRRIALGFVAWLVVETAFFTSAAAARAEVHSAVSHTLHDVVLTPEIGNPLCFRALVVRTDGGRYSPAVPDHSVRYSVRSMTVAPFPSVRDASACGAPSALGGTIPPAAYTSSRSIRFGSEWTAPLQELVALAAMNCEIAAALQFMRVPVWTRMPNGAIELSDLRYSEGGNGFASIVSQGRPAVCPRNVPGWDAPRSDVLRIRG